MDSRNRCAFTRPSATSAFALSILRDGLMVAPPGGGVLDGGRKAGVGTMTGSRSGKVSDGSQYFAAQQRRDAVRGARENVAGRDRPV